MLMISNLLGIFTGSVAIILLARWTSLPQIVLGGAVLEFSFVMVISEFAAELGVTLNGMMFLVFFLCSAAVGAYVMFQLRPKLTFKSNDAALIALGVGLILLFFQLTFPSALPSSDGVDAVGHYMIADNILQTGNLNGYAAWYSQVAPELGYAGYPYGYHVTAAFIAQDTGLPLISILQPFGELLIAATICIMVFLSIETAGCERRFAPLLAVLAVACPYTFDLLTSGYYAQLMGILLTLGFCWLLVSFIKGSAGTWVLLSIVDAAIWLTYPYLVIVPNATLVLILVCTRSRKLIVQSAAVFLVSTLLAFPRVLWFFQTALPYYLPATGATLPFRNLLPVVSLGAIGFLSFLLAARRRRVILGEFIVPCLLGAVVFQTAALYVLDIIKNYGSYFFLKSGYFAAFVLIAMAGRCFKANSFRFASPSHFWRKYAIPALLLLLICGNVAFGAFVNVQAVVRVENLALSRPVYDAAVWVWQNVPSNVSVECIASPPLPFWVFAISHHAPPMGGGWWVQPPPSKNEWLRRATNGSVLVVVAGPAIPPDWLIGENTLNLSDFAVMFHEDNVFVLVLNPSGHDQPQPPPNSTPLLLDQVPPDPSDHVNLRRDWW